MDTTGGSRAAIMLLFLALSICVVHGAREKVFNVIDNGAKAGGSVDDKETNTLAFIKTWNAACKAGGTAKVLIPAGKFLISAVIWGGPCASTSIIVEINAELLASTDVSEYSSPEWISVEKVTGVTVLGRGTLNGQGEQVWKYNNCAGNKKGCSLLCVSLKLRDVKNTVVKGIKFVNSQGFHMGITESNNIRVENVHITAPADSPNTDGIHTSRTDGVIITNSVIGTGDDCVSIGEGTTNIEVSNIKCGPGHGISIGSLGKRKGEGSVKGVTVANCTLTNADNGARIKTWPNSPSASTASSIVFKDITMTNVRRPIIIDQEYSCGSKVCSKPASKVKLSDIHFVNIKGTAVPGDAVITIKCSKGLPCDGVELKNVVLKGDTETLCTNAKLKTTGTVTPPPGCK